jgi:hypothetical protein
VPATIICRACLRSKKSSVAAMPRESKMLMKTRSKSTNEATENDSTTVTTNAVRRSKLVATQSGTAAIGIQSSEIEVNSIAALAAMANRPIAPSTPACTRSSLSR